ncbi:hypothetical protein R75461_05937 [Paraburkholderia nemoris]|nr:hypothetical protein R75461_05937 [Paraburkholderia nemoris]
MLKNYLKLVDPVTSWYWHGKGSSELTHALFNYMHFRAVDNPTSVQSNGGSVQRHRIGM